MNKSLLPGIIATSILVGGCEKSPEPVSSPIYKIRNTAQQNTQNILDTYGPITFTTPKKIDAIEMLDALLSKSIVKITIPNHAIETQTFFTVIGEIDAPLQYTIKSETVTFSPENTEISVQIDYNGKDWEKVVTIASSQAVVQSKNKKQYTESREIKIHTMAYCTENSNIQHISTFFFDADFQKNIQNHTFIPKEMYIGSMPAANKNDKTPATLPHGTIITLQ